MRSSLICSLVLFASVAFTLLAGACTAASSPQTLSSRASSSAGATPVPWVDRPAAPWTPTPTPTLSTEELFAPCKGGQLKAEFVEGGGYAGGYGEVFRLTNASSSNCSLSGFPVVDGIRADGTREQLYTEPEGVDPVMVNLHPGDGASIQFTFRDCGLDVAGRTPVSASDGFASAVVVPPGGGDVTLPRGSGPEELQAIPPDEDGFRCGGNLDGYTALSSPSPVPNPYAAVTATLRLPAAITVGSSVDFTLTLTNTGAANVDLTPCPSYHEGLVVAGQAVGLKSYQLDCDAGKSIPAHSSITYAMRYDVPDVNAASGEFAWSLFGWPPPAPEFVIARATVALSAP